MGSPLAPLLAEWFVSNIENNILKSNIDCKPTFYRRYVDDTFALFKCEQDRDNFFAILNAAHPNLQFTMEVSSGSLPFLDSAIAIKDNQFETKVYRKPTNTGVLLNYNSVAPKKWKRSLIRCLLTRAHRVSSSFALFEAELESLREEFLKNSYPPNMIDSTIADFVKTNKISEERFKVNSEMRQKEGVAEIKDIYVRIPYVGKPSLRLQRRIQENLILDKVNIKAAFWTTKVGEYFNLKSKCSRLFTANVVYKFTCSSDSGITYLGETKRQLFKRVSDHKGNDKNSAVLQHLQGCVHCQNSNVSNCFEIVERCSPKNICSTEALLIAKHCPSLNTQLGPSKGTVVSLSLY